MRARERSTPLRRPADKIAEFASSSEEVLGAGTSEGPRHGAIIQSGVPLKFLRSEQEEEAVWKAQFEAGSQIQNHLGCALGLHRTTDLQISQVGASLPGIVGIWSWFCAFHSRSSIRSG